MNYVLLFLNEQVIDRRPQLFMKSKEIEIIVEYGEEDLKCILLQEFIKYATNKEKSDKK